MKKHKSLLVVNNIPTPYRSSLYASMYRICRNEGIDFSVRYLSNSETVRSWSVDLNGYERVFKVLFQRRNSRTTTSDIIINGGFILEAISNKKVICFGYNYHTYIAISAIRRMIGRKTTLFCETTQADKKRSKFKDYIKYLALNTLFSQFIVPGLASRKYLTGLGVDNEKIFTAVNSSNLVASGGHYHSREEGVSFLYVGRISKEKRVLELASFFSQNPSSSTLTIVGDGPEKSELENICKSTSNVKFIGPRSGDNLVEVYNSHQALILVSESEPWGIVVNEAINFGLALILSDKVGSSSELLDGNGVKISELSLDSLLCAIQDVENNVDKYRRGSEILSKKFTPDIQAKSMIDAVFSN